MAYNFLNVFKKGLNRSSLYGYASQLVSLNTQQQEVAQRLLDSARVEINRMENPGAFQPNRHQVAIALMYLDPDKNSKEAYRTIKNTFDKFNAITRFSRAYAFRGNLYEAQQQAPLLISAADKSFFLINIVKGYNLKQNKKEEWTKFQDNRLIFSRNVPIYLNENE